MLTGSKSTPFRIVVAGDVVVDHHVYEGERTIASDRAQRGARVVRELGGAAGVATLIQAVLDAARIGRERAEAGAKAEICALHCAIRKAEESADAQVMAKLKKQAIEAEGRLSEIKPRPEEACTATFALHCPDVHAQPEGHHSLATWKPFPKDPTDPKNKDRVWRAGLVMGYGDDSAPLAGNTSPSIWASYVPIASAAADSPQLLVLDDSGFAFRNKAQERCWLLPARDATAPECIILKMSGPVCQGDLWHEVAGHFADRLVCIVSADDLRQECVQVSRGLSWEDTVDDVRAALQNSPNLKPLSTVPRHLIVSFASDGALWLDNTNRECPAATLIFDASGAEGQWAEQFGGKAFGYLSCLVAAIARATIPSSPTAMPGAIADGLAAMRDLLANGHGPVGKSNPSGFPKSRLATTILEGTGEFAFSRVPWSDQERAAYSAKDRTHAWRIVEMSQAPFPTSRAPSLLGLAKQVVLKGASAIKRLPHATFGGLLTADRDEIETLRSIRRLMLDYREPRPTKRPLSIGVFGPPGAGKSFGVKQLADKVFGKEAWIEFNLSQFNGAIDLIGAFHQVRDRVLGGTTPVVFWDEFDSKEYDWLQYLLAPMQDGRFQEGQVSHAIGKCVFVFAGATSHTFEEFGPPDSDAAASRTYRLRKGPDFHSRLDAYYNVLGPNQRMLLPAGDGTAKETGDRVPDAEDVCVPLRRALLVRTFLEVPKDARLDFDPELLDALLRVAGYRHGARSLEKLVVPLRPGTPGQPIRRSALPPAAQVAMHVDSDKRRPDLVFQTLLDANIGFKMSQAIEALAEAIHNGWLKKYAADGNPMKVPWKELPEPGREDNRAAARRIPDVLALAGLALVCCGDGAQPFAQDTESELVVTQIDHHIERLAEAEHDGWMDQRVKNGWTYGPVRDDGRKIHHLLKPYAELPNVEQNKDRASVRDYPAHAAAAGYRIAFA